VQTKQISIITARAYPSHYFINKMRRHRDRPKRSSSKSDDEPPKASSSFSPFLSSNNSNNSNSFRWKKFGSSSSLKPNEEARPTSTINTISLEQAYHELKLSKDRIPTITDQKNPSHDSSPSSISSSTESITTLSKSNDNRPRSAMSATAVSQDENRKRKIATRVISGMIMVSVFLLFIYLGHFYICTMIFLMEAALVRICLYFLL